MKSNLMKHENHPSAIENQGSAPRVGWSQHQTVGIIPRYFFYFLFKKKKKVKKLNF